VETMAQRAADAFVLQEHARHASERYEELAKLMGEYEEGILLYRIEQDEIWKKIQVNDSLLHIYYQSHKENYRWADRVNFAEIYVLSDSAAKAAYWKLQYGEDFLSVAQEFTVRPGYREKKGEWGFQAYSANGLATKASTMWVDSVTVPFKYESGWSILKVLARDPARIKTFEETGAELASGYQDEVSKKREQEWLESLRQKYPVIIDRTVLNNAFKQKRSATP
jgi:peptidyl-prolyl cis-trans isomerase SurA